MPWKLGCFFRPCGGIERFFFWNDIQTVLSWRRFNGESHIAFGVLFFIFHPFQSSRMIQMRPTHSRVILKRKKMVQKQDGRSRSFLGGHENSAPFSICFSTLEKRLPVPVKFNRSRTSHASRPWRCCMVVDETFYRTHALIIDSFVTKTIEHSTPRLAHSVLASVVFLSKHPHNK